MIILGIDPGQTGGLGQLSTTSDSVSTFSFTNTSPKDTADHISIYHNSKVKAYIENVHSMPKQGVASSFKFGKNFGFLLGCLASYNIPYELVTPSVWQRKLGCLSKGDKNVTKAKAQQLFPNIKMTHSIADALLIAEYGKRKELEL